MPDFLVTMLGQIPLKQREAMSRSRAIVTGLSKTMSCAEVVVENWLNRVFNILNESDDFSGKLQRDAREICYEHMENMCDFKTLGTVRDRWSIGMQGLNVDRASQAENRQVTGPWKPKALWTLPTLDAQMPRPHGSGPRTLLVSIQGEGASRIALVGARMSIHECVNGCLE